MKKIRILQIASILLCLVMLLASCDKNNNENANNNNNNNQQPEVPDTPVTAVGESNFFTLSYKEPDHLVQPTLMTDTYGELMKTDSSEGLLVFLKKTKDFMNNVTDTYTVYSVADNAVVKTFALTYADEDYGRMDDFNNPVLPEKSLKVRTVGDYIDGHWVGYITAIYTTNTPLSKEVIEDNKLTHSYSSSYNVEFYDAKGTAITTSKNVIDGEEVAYAWSDDRLALSFGKTVAVFDIKENKLLYTCDGDTKKVHGINADFSNDKYDYYLNVPYGYVDYRSPLGYGGKIEVYDKNEELVFEYVYNDFSTYAYAHVLANGDILLQTYKSTEKIDYSYLTQGTKVDMQTFLLDVETGKATEVAFNYILGDTYSQDELKELLEEENNTNISFVDANIRNIALARKVENGYIVKNYEELVFFDNFLTVNHVYSANMLEQQSSSFAVKLSGGYELIDVINGAAEKAIVKDGKIVSYVPEGATVTEYGVISGNKIYNFEMVESTSWGTEDNREGYALKGTLGKYAIFEHTVTPDEFDEPFVPYKVVRVYDMSSKTWANSYDRSVISSSSDGDYVIIYNELEKSYSLYNENMTCLLTGNAIHVEECEDGYVVELTVDNAGYVFFMTYNSNQNNVTEGA